MRGKLITPIPPLQPSKSSAFSLTSVDGRTKVPSFTTLLQTWSQKCERSKKRQRSSSAPLENSVLSACLVTVQWNLSPSTLQCCCFRQSLIFMLLTSSPQPNLPILPQQEENINGGKVVFADSGRAKKATQRQSGGVKHGGQLGLHGKKIIQKYSNTSFKRNPQTNQAFCACVPQTGGQTAVSLPHRHRTRAVQEQTPPGAAETKIANCFSRTYSVFKQALILLFGTSVASHTENTHTQSTARNRGLYCIVCCPPSQAAAPEDWSAASHFQIAVP